MRILSTACLLIVLVAIPAAAQITADLDNLGLATSGFVSGGFFFEDIFNPPVIGDGFVAFSVYEGAQGGTDLNGDGDVIDFVVHVRDSADGTVVNLGLAADSFRDFVGASILLGAYENLLFFTVQERSQGADLNGDGDAFDYLLHVYDHLAGTVTNLGVDAVVRGRLGSRFMIRVWEGADGMDRNGDGDATDSVVHLYDPTTGAVTNTGLAGNPLAALPGAQLAAPLVAVSESQQGSVDLNGDGDTRDYVLHRFDPGGGPPTNLGVAVRTGVGFNGDGMAVFLRDDRVAQIYDAATQSIVDTGLATNDFFASGTLALLEVSEWRQGADLNGDGDTNDAVVHVYDAATGIVHNLGRAWRDKLIGRFQGRSDGRFVLFPVGEAYDGGQDLNGDGDITADEDVLHVWDAESQTLHNVGIAMAFGGAASLVTASHGFSFLADESKQGADLNGDGDTDDFPLQFYDALTQTVQNIGVGVFASDLLLDVAAPGLGAPGMGISYRHETIYGDLNGDGDLLDYVLAFYDFMTGLTTSTGVAVDLSSGFGYAARDGVLAVVVSESGQGATDLNGDGDLDDGVLFVTATGNPPSGDADLDGVADGDDLCADTVIPESSPTVRLGVNRWALVDDDGVFETTSPAGVGPRRSYTVSATGGCSCEQIVAALGVGEGHLKYGCSIGVMDDWVAINTLSLF